MTIFAPGRGGCLATVIEVDAGFFLVVVVAPEGIVDHASASTPADVVAILAENAEYAECARITFKVRALIGVCDAVDIPTWWNEHEWSAI